MKHPSDGLEKNKAPPPPPAPSRRKALIEDIRYACAAKVF